MCIFYIYGCDDDAPSRGDAGFYIYCEKSKRSVPCTSCYYAVSSKLGGLYEGFYNHYDICESIIIKCQRNYRKRLNNRKNKIN